MWYNELAKYIIGGSFGYWDDKLITSCLKEYSGDSTIKTRCLYNDPIEFIPQFKLIAG